MKKGHFDAARLMLGLGCLVFSMLFTSTTKAQAVFSLSRPNSVIKFDDPSGRVFSVAEGVAVLDANADGLLDLLYPPSYNNHEPELPLEIFLNMGGGRFVESASSVINIVPTVGYLNHPTLIGDFNGDGADDAFLVDHGLEIGDPPHPGAQPKLLLSNGTGGLNNATSTHLPQMTEFNHTGSIGDVDNDGDLDILVVALSDIHVYLLVNDGTGHFELRTDLFPDTDPSSYNHVGAVTLADVNGDCRLDVILGSFFNEPPNFVAISLQTESGTFADHQRFLVREDIIGIRMDQIVAEDFDGDRDVDIIAKFDLGSGWNDAGLIALRNDNGNFVEVTDEWLGASRFVELLPSPYVAGLEVHDINGDGAPDLFFAHYGIPFAQLDQYLLLNDGKGHFSPMPNAAIDDPMGIIPFYADFDADGDLDIVGYMPDFAEVAPGEYVHAGYEIVVLENTSNIAKGNISFQCPPVFKDGFED